VSVPLVLYHDNCPDGFTAAWAVHNALGDEAEYRGVNYGQSPPDDIAGRRVILVDFSYPRAVLDAMAEVASVEVYDHHKTAEADLTGWTAGKCVFDVKRSGAGIAWDEFMPRIVRPKLVNYVEDRDLWRWALPDSREVSEFLFSVERTFTEWDQADAAVAYYYEQTVEAGKALLRAKRQRVALMCKHARWGRIGGRLCRYVNASWDFSEVGEYLSDPDVAPEAEFGAYYFDRADMRQWGMRTRREDVDVSAIAKLCGGGGHRAAAGFQTAIGWLPDPA
jgi:uncharacterized protein